MKISSIAFRPVAAAILVLGALLGSACASRPGGAAAGDDRAPAGSAFRLASTLSGSYRGVGNDLRLRFDSTGSLLTGTAFNLYLTASGSYGGRSVNEQGILHLESQGRGVRAAFIPHFDAGESPLSPTATQFSATELNAACAVDLRPYRRGWAGRPQGSTSCARAIRGGRGEWVVEVQPNALVLQDAATRERLRFEKVS